MSTEQNRAAPVNTSPAVRAQAEVAAALEACDLILSRLRSRRRRRSSGMKSVRGGVSPPRRRRLADDLGELLDDLVERDPGAPGEEWPDLTVTPAAPSPS
jgi:hypothetical protein